MRPAAQYLEIFLQPGEFHFTDDPDTRLRTLLGSCVAMTMWHPRLRYGAMCHYLLPTRAARKAGSLDGRFGDEAYLMFLSAAVRHHSDPNDYEIKLFGGGDMFPSVRNKPAIGHENLRAGFELLKLHGQAVKARHVGGNGHRIVMLDAWNGAAWVKHHGQPAMATDGRVSA